MKKISKFILGFMGVTLLVSGCAKQVEKDVNVKDQSAYSNEQGKSENESKSKANLQMTSIDDLSNTFKSDEENWFVYNSSLNLKKQSAELKSTGVETAEAWYKYDRSFPYNSDFKISAKVKVPRAWESHSKKEAQVGVGLFIGKKGDGGKLVYESDLCVIANQVRFVQGQMVKNRKGGEPVKVDFKEVKEEEGTLSLIYDKDQKAISLFFNNELVGSQKIDKTGAVDWKMKDLDEFVVGIMGFSEKVEISSDYPSISSVEISK